MLVTPGISVTSDRLKVERKVFAWGFSKEYLLDEARNFRVLESPTVQSAFAGNRGDYWGFPEERLRLTTE